MRIFINPSLYQQRISRHALWSDPFEIIYSSLSFSISPILCSSLDIGPRNIFSFLIGWSPELIELRRMLVCPKYCSFDVCRRVWVVLNVKLFAVSRTQAKSGRSAGRQAARMPTLVSTLGRKLASRDKAQFWMGVRTLSRSHMCRCYSNFISI